jgi:tRNA A-37 threonylcarbamoyl transferase component Bud32
MRLVRAILIWICLLVPAFSQERMILQLHTWPPNAEVWTAEGEMLGLATTRLVVARPAESALHLVVKAPYYQETKVDVPLPNTSGEYPPGGAVVALQPTAWWVPAYTYAQLYPVPVMWGVLALGFTGVGVFSFWFRSRNEQSKLSKRARHLESLPGSGADGLVGSTVDRWRVVEQLGPNMYAAVLDEELLTGGPRFLLRIPETDAPSIARFQREVQIGATLTHPNVVKLEDYGTWNGTPYLVTELVPGQTLRELMPLSLEKAREIFPQVMGAVSFVHTQQAIHRNLTPESIRVRPDGRVVLMDFSLAARTQRNEISGASAPVGKVEYQAPEQKKRHFITQRTDQYTLGLTLAEVLTPERPEAVSEILQKMQAEDPKDRYHSVQEALDALRAVL